MNYKPGTAGYPGFPDIEKIELERVLRKQRGQLLKQTTEYLKSLQEAEQTRKGIKQNVEQS